MRAGDQWRLIEENLPVGWEEARLAFLAEDAPGTAAAAAVLGPIGPGRVGNEVRFSVHPSGSANPQKLTNLLGHLDRKRIWGTLSLRETITADEVEPSETIAPSATKAPEAAPLLLLAAWEALLATLPSDWSDLLCELELDSTDYLATASLLGAPLNPSRIPGEIALRFRVSGKQGYGASPLMARRCFERMDARGVTGRLSAANVLSDTENVATQGAVWRVAGRSV